MESDRWRRETWAPSVQERPERRSQFVNDAGNTVEPLYTPASLEAEGFDYLRDLGFPGEFPYTRGIDPAMYRRELPIVAAYAGYGTPKDANLRYKKLIGFGVEGISMALDLPTQLGFDADHIMARAEVGRVGVSICTLRDMEIAFEDIPLDSLKFVGSTANAIGPIILAMYTVLGEKQGLDKSRFTVRLQNDVLKEYVARGTQIFPISPAMRFTVDALEWCVHEAPHWVPITASGTHMDVAGAGSTAAAAFTLSNAKCYIEEALRRGLTIDDVAPLLFLFPNEREDFFLAVANYRVIRRIWAKMMRDQYGAKDPRSWQARIHGYAHGPRATVQEPLNNIVRLTLGALACYFGGMQDLRSASFDEGINTPSEEAVRTTIRMQQILAHEYGITATIDPLAGSYYLESLTNRMEREINAIMQRVDSFGGAIGAIESGFIQKTITEGAVRRQRAFERGERVTVGWNKFPSNVPMPEVTFQVDKDVERKRIEHVQQVRLERDSCRVSRCLDAITSAAKEGRNLMPAILEAVRAYASVGEICGTLKSIFGEYQPDRSF